MGSQSAGGRQSFVVLLTAPRTFTSQLSAIAPSLPQAIRAPDNGTAGHVYAVYTLGDGYAYNGPPQNCGGAPVPPPPPPPPPPHWSAGPCSPGVKPHGDGWSGCITANFSIFWSGTPNGTYQRHTAQILVCLRTGAVLAPSFRVLPYAVLFLVR